MTDAGKSLSHGAEKRDSSSRWVERQSRRMMQCVCVCLHTGEELTLVTLRQKTAWNNGAQFCSIVVGDNKHHPLPTEVVPYTSIKYSTVQYSKRGRPVGTSMCQMSSVNVSCPPEPNQLAWPSTPQNSGVTYLTADEQVPPNALEASQLAASVPIIMKPGRSSEIRAEPFTVLQSAVDGANPPTPRKPTCSPCPSHQLDHIKQ